MIIYQIATLLLSLLFPPANAVPVYRSPDSPFASGNLNANKLEKQILRSENHQWYYVKAGSQQGWIERHHVYTVWDFATEAIASTDLKLFSEKNREKEGLQIKKGTYLQVLATNENLLYVSYNKKSYWADEADFVLDTTDLGYFYIKTSENKQTKMAINNILDAQFVIQKEKHQIYKNLSLLRFVDSLFIPSTSRFVSVNNITQRGFILNDLSFVGFSKDLKKLYDFSIGFSKSNTPLYQNASRTSGISGSVVEGQRLEITEREVEKWHLSKTEENGSLWWTQNSNHPLMENVKAYTTEDLFKRKIFSLEAMKGHDGLMFASAQGVFRSHDGKNWIKIESFGDKNYPIASSANGTIFIGQKRSRDGGYTFEDYLAWHKIARSLNHVDKKIPEMLELRKIKPLDKEGNQLELHIHTGEKLKSIFSLNGGTSWYAL